MYQPLISLPHIMDILIYAGVKSPYKMGYNFRSSLVSGLKKEINVRLRLRLRMSHRSQLAPGLSSPLPVPLFVRGSATDTATVTWEHSRSSQV